MHRHSIVVLALVVFATAASAQWQPPEQVSGSIYYNGGNVGIGTSTPVTKLEIPGSQTNSSAKFGSFEIQGYALNNAWLGENVYYNSGFVRRDAGSGTLLYFSQGRYSVRTFGHGPAATGVAPVQRFIVLTDGTVGLGGSQTNGTTAGANMIVDAAGNVGIGVTPTARLHVSGHAQVTGNLSVDGNLAAKYQDVAEWVPAFGDPAAGTVVVLSNDAANHVTASHTAYDTRVAGVVSEQPGLILGEAAEDRVKVATTGRVRVKVDATAAPIEIGDLLVTSDQRGVAMKSIPVELGGVAIHRPGTIVGKALEPLKSGTGEILVLLSLQ
jgi:hypothetical protein